LKPTAKWPAACGGGQAQLGDIAQQFAADMQPLFDLEGIVQVGVVDKTLPAHGGARLLKIDAHDNQQGVGNLLGDRLQAVRIIHGGIHVVDGAGANHHHQAVVLAVEDVAHGGAASGHGGLGGFAHRQLGLERFGADQDVLGDDIQVVELLCGHVIHYLLLFACPSGIPRRSGALILLTALR